MNCHKLPNYNNNNPKSDFSLGLVYQTKKISIWLVLIRLIYHDIKIEEHFQFSTQTLWENFKESLYQTSLSVI